jgi:hypothetical protein
MTPLSHLARSSLKASRDAVAAPAIASPRSRVSEYIVEVSLEEVSLITRRRIQYLAGIALTAAAVPSVADASPSTYITKQQARAAINALDARQYVALNTRIASCKRLAANSVRCQLVIPREQVACPNGNFNTNGQSWENVVTNTLVTTTDYQGVIQYVAQTSSEHGRTPPALVLSLNTILAACRRSLPVRRAITLLPV